MSLPEVLLWRVLKGSPASFRFRRQHPLGPYVLDFYCHAARLAVEVDGVGHRMADRPARDAARDRWLAGQGVDVLRLPAAEVLRDVDAAAHSIVETARARAPSTAFGGPPPPKGEDPRRR